MFFSGPSTIKKLKLTQSREWEIKRYASQEVKNTIEVSGNGVKISEK